MTRVVAPPGGKIVEMTLAIEELNITFDLEIMITYDRVGVPYIKGGIAMSHAKEHQTDELLKRLNKIEGQVSGIKKMVVANKDYGDIMIQLNSARSAIQKSAKSSWRPKRIMR